MLVLAVRGGLFVVVGALAASTCQSGTPVPVETNPKLYTNCTTTADCELGEIDHEIRSRADCNCLYGCVYLPLNKQTVARRKQQHQSLCDPERNEQGEPCGIDDCAVPPQPTCVAGLCTIVVDAGS
jgi:hypothetical protein